MTNFYNQRWAKPYLTPSIAVELLTKTPFHAKRRCPYYGLSEEKSSSAMDEGSIVDGLVLGRGPEVTVIYVNSFSTNHAKALRDGTREKGRIPVKATDWRRMNAAAAEVAGAVFSQSLTASAALTKGIIKERIFWEDDGVHCSTEPDAFQPIGQKTVLDLKRTKIAPTADRWQRHAAKMFLHVQCAACLEGTGAEKFGWIVVEAEEPHCVVVHWASDMFIAVGQRDWNYAKAVWKNCVESDYFPAYESGEIDPMAWLIGDDREETNYALTEEGEES